MVETVLKSAIFIRVIPGITRVGGLGGLGGISLPGYEQARHSGLRKHLSRIPLRGDAGAISLAKSYGLLVREDEQFINALTQIRNRYAHSLLNHSKSVFDIIHELGEPSEMILKKLRYERGVDLIDPDRAGV